MVLSEEAIAALVSRYIKDGMVLSFGTSSHSETFVKKLALKVEDEGLHVSVVPTSSRIAAVIASLGIPMASINDEEIDVGVEFADAVDNGFNYIKRDSVSFVRDKMIAQSAAELIIIAEEKNYGKKLRGILPLEIAIFGWKRTLVQAGKLGKAKLRNKGTAPFMTETGHYVVDVDVDEIYSLEDLEYQAKDIPGVLETGLFIGYADRVVLHNGKLRVKSRMDYSKQNELVE
jgi:ribose 5-phosphate isomerase A